MAFNNLVMLPTAEHLQITTSQLEQAFAWLCKQRSHYPDNADIWWFRAHLDEQKAALLATLNSGDYVFLPQLKCCKKDGQVLHLWSSQDALVLKPG